MQARATSMRARGSIFVLSIALRSAALRRCKLQLKRHALYFTCIANGVSRMFRSDDLLRVIRDAGLEVVAEHDQIGRGHTLSRVPQSALALRRHSTIRHSMSVFKSRIHRLRAGPVAFLPANDYLARLDHDFDALVFELADDSDVVFPRCCIPAS